MTGDFVLLVLFSNEKNINKKKRTANLIVVL